MHAYIARRRTPRTHSRTHARPPSPARLPIMPSSSALLTPKCRMSNDDEHDQIGSNSSTPPGASTPRPDPTDKRLPGILHSYFGQVRDSLIPRRKSSAVNPSPALAPVTQTADPSSKEESDASLLPSNTLPSPTPSASSTSRHPSTSQLNDGEPEKLTEGAYAPPHNQATPPQTPRTRSQEGKRPASSLSQSTLASNQQKTKEKETRERGPADVGPPKGKLSVAISEGRNLRPSVDPYVVCQFQWAEYISDGPRNDTPKDKRHPLAIQRTDSETGKPMAIPMRSRQSSNNGTNSDPRENGSLKDVTNPKWEHEAIL